VLKNEAACCEVQTHFESFRLASFVKKCMDAILRFICPKTKLFAVKFRCILEFSLCEVYEKYLGRTVTICASKN